MKLKLLLICLVFMGSCTTHHKSPNKLKSANPNYDAQLAQKLGADDYGMKSFVFVILKTGTNTDTDKELKNKAFRGHFENINKLVESKQMIVAGPMGKNNDSYRGIFILNVKSIQEAQLLLQNDTAIKEKYLEAVYYDWYGSAALPVYLEAADKVWKKDI